MSQVHGKFPINKQFKVLKGFLSEGKGDDSWTFSCSVGSFPRDKNRISKKHPEDVYGYEWTAGLTLRVGSTMIRLHEPTADYGLIRMETKLLMVHQKLIQYTDTIKERLDKPVKKKLLERNWLNPVEWDSDYTGYVSAYISGDGHARVTLADCHRAISLWFDPPYFMRGEETPVPDKFTLDNLKLCQAMGNAALEGVNQIDVLRGSFKRLIEESERTSK